MRVRILRPRVSCAARIPCDSDSGGGVTARARLILVFAVIGAASPASAQDRVSLASLIDEALATHPSIVAATGRQRAATERIAQERSLPDPMVSAGYTSVGNPLPGAGIRSDPFANVSVMASQTLPYPGTRSLRAAYAAREADAEAPLIDAARIELVSRVKQAYYRLARVYETADVLQRNVDLLDTLLKVSETRYAVGQAAQQDVIKAQTEASIIELQQRRLNQERLAIETELNTLRSRPAFAPVGRPEDLSLVAFEHQLEPLLATARDAAPMLKRDRALIAAAESGVALARQSSKPDFTISGGYSYSVPMPRMFEARIDMNVPLRKAKRVAAIAEQTARLGAATADFDTNRLLIEGELQAQYRAATTAIELARLYRDTVLPQSRLALESSISSYASGSIDFLSVLSNFASVLQYETSYVDELMNFHVATSLVEAMTGAPLVH